MARAPNDIGRCSMAQYYDKTWHKVKWAGSTGSIGYKAHYCYNTITHSRDGIILSCFNTHINTAK